MTTRQPQPGTVSPATPVRLGVIDYLNVRPVYAWLLQQLTLDERLVGIETRAGTPTAMNAALAAGDLDVSNVSSVAFGQHAQEWVLLPRLAVAARGRVESVLLFSWHDDWQALDQQPIAVTSHSATSVALLRVLCEQRDHVHPHYVVQEPDLDVMLATHEAALLIGDQALRERWAPRAVAGRKAPHVFDLAAEWTTWTGLPFVFALWAGRAERASALRQSDIAGWLRRSTDWGLAHLDQLAAEAAPRLGLTPTNCADYLRLLDYTLSAETLAGLRAFFERSLPGFSWETVRVLEHEEVTR
jgi:chorismate dehydratase